MSVKRRAAADLNHDNWDKEEKNEEIGTFKTAPGDVLEKRVFRLAKRRSQNVPGHESKKPVFSGFGGFNKAQPSSFDFLANLTKGANAPTTANSATLNVNASDMKPFGSNIFTTPTSTSATGMSFGKLVTESTSSGNPPDADSTVNENLFKAPVTSGSTTSGFNWKAPENSTLPSSIFGVASSNSNNKSLFASNATSPFQIQTTSNASQIKLDTQTQNQMPQIQASQTQAFQFKSPPAEPLQFKAPQTQSPQFKAPQTQTSQLQSSQSQSSLFQAPPTTQNQTSQSQIPSVFQTPQPQTSQFESPQSQTSLFKAPQTQSSQFQSPQSQTSLFQTPQTQTTQFQSPQSQTSLFQAPQTQTTQLQSPQSQTSLFQAPKIQTSQFQSPQSQSSLFQTPQTQTSQFQTPPGQSSLFQSQTPHFKSPQSQTSLFQTPQTQTTQSQGSQLWTQPTLPANENVTKNKTEIKTSENKTNSQNVQENKLTYYSKLKGLNVSVLEWIKKHVDETPLCILTPIFKDYEKYLVEIQNEYESSKKEEKETTSDNVSTKISEANQHPPVTVNNSVASLFAASVNAPKSIFSSAIKSTTQSPSFSFGFTSTPSTNTTSSGFTFGSSSTQSTSTTSSPFAVSTSNSMTNGQQPFSFGSGKPFSFNSNIQTQSNTENTNESAEENDEPPKVEFTPVVEENSVFDKRCKIFIKKDNNFVDKGVGTLYIKKINDSEKHQLLVRANTNLGNILLNLVLTSSIPTQRMGKNNVMLVCIPTPEAKPPPVPILIRVKTSEEADDLLNTLDKYKA
ncbi:nuclear pore complex protein Nup50 [Papilio machaon]|uniref:nuclear pore complex protein Nup50 n=1 Tax=Papilio machaon TaxID=76193 RepID=UPI001E665818|nr:nuclear pore complex protein Nup50 [Papilio machaon]